MTGHALVVRLDNTGDVLLAGPAIRAVAAGSDRVTFLCGPLGAAAAQLLPAVDEVLEFAAPWILACPPPVDAEVIGGLVDSIRARAVDTALILTSFHQSPLPAALLLRLAGVATIGAVCEDYPGSLLDVRHHVDDNVHEVERSLSLAGEMGFALPAGDDGRLAVRGPLPPVPADVGALRRPPVVVHPGASTPARAWEPFRMRELVSALASSGRGVVVTGSPAEQPLTRFVAGGHPAAVDLGGRTDLPELAAVLRAAEVVVAGNTGPAHLAAAVGTPVVSLFAPTVPAVRWRPWKVPVRVLGWQDIGCAGCRARVCPVAGHPCLGSLSTDVVVAAVDQLAAEGVAA